MAIPAQKTQGMSREERKVIFASSLGTVFEWYDFYLYGALTTLIGNNFFTALDSNSKIIFTLLAFAAGFIVRPFGALIFGRLGDLVGRKHTFLITIIIMGSSTFLVGCLPTFAVIGYAAPILLIGLRLLQGLALGGEYGGAATYVAEHAPPGKRGYFTSWIQTTATLGLFLSLLVILATKFLLGKTEFEEWGWRIPFWLSALLLGVSVWIRMSMNESPAFLKMKAEGRASKAPLTESFMRWPNLKRVILALFGLTAGQAVIWYCGHFYALLFLTNTLKVDETTAYLLIVAALAIGTPFFIIFGALSDKIGRKPIIMAGCLIAALSYTPLFQALTVAANPQLAAAQNANHIVVTASPQECSILFNPTNTKKFTSSCDIARSLLAKNSANYEMKEGNGLATIAIGNTIITAYSGAGLSKADSDSKDAEFKKSIADTLKSAGYPTSADPKQINTPKAILILSLLVIFVTMVYGPIAAMLVEFFPTRIRYSSMSLPYHIGNGWFGGLLPAIVVAIVAETGSMYSGLRYPILIAGISFVIGMLFIKETKDVDLDA